MAAIISSKDVYNIIRHTLSMVNPDTMAHGEATGYILAKMLECENAYNKQDIADYAMLGILHDLGLYKKQKFQSRYVLENYDVWAHSVYGYLFLKCLSPLEEKAELVLYHHLDYRLYGMIQSKFLRIISYLNIADKMDTFMHMKKGEMEQDYFKKYRDIKFSGYAFDLFYKTESKFKILSKLRDDSFRLELAEILSARVFSENAKRRFLEMLTYTIDFRSVYTVDHTMATTAFAREIGKCMRLSSMELQKLYYGALLHDVGKLAIPVEILDSPRRLTDEEMRIMKTHVEITEDILTGVINDEILKIAVRHHEKLDGTGYPYGLRGEELTLPQRIVAVADIISALHGKRSYKDPLPSETIKQIIKEDADNSKLCPKVVDCAIRNYNTVMRNFEAEQKATMHMYLVIKEQYDVIYEKFKDFK